MGCGVAVVGRTGVAFVGESDVIRDPVVDKAGGIGAVTAAGTGVTVVAGMDQARMLPARFVQLIMEMA
ncbi:MAG: hypothetical protein CL702_11750 [Chloroflexi bacterium]|nr:hypothetical protein [Chloroflexota bacterium]